MHWHPDLPWRSLILDEPKDHLWNMALDEFLFTHNQQEVVFRAYRWKPCSLSLGYFQNVQKHVELYQCESTNTNIVRRITGGGTVLHGQDITLSFILPENNRYFSSKVTESYRDIHNIIMNALSSKMEDLSFFEDVVDLQPRSGRVCFEQPTNFDIQQNGKKIVGSSQRRKHGILLHQTSMLLPLDFSEAISLIQAAFADKFGIKFEGMDLLDQDIEKINYLIKSKYDTPIRSYTATI